MPRRFFAAIAVAAALAAACRCPAGRAPGESCTRASECASGQCLVSIGGSGVCTRACESTADCPAGMVCAPIDLSDDAGVDVPRVCLFPAAADAADGPDGDGGDPDRDGLDAADESDVSGEA